MVAEYFRADDETGNDAGPDTEPHFDDETVVGPEPGMDDETVGAGAAGLGAAGLGAAGLDDMPTSATGPTAQGTIRLGEDTVRLGGRAGEPGYGGGLEDLTGYLPNGTEATWRIRFNPRLEITGPSHRVRRGVTDKGVHVAQKIAVAGRTTGGVGAAEQLREETEVYLDLWHLSQRAGAYPPEIAELVGYSNSGEEPFLLITALPGGEALSRQPPVTSEKELDALRLGLLRGLHFLDEASLVHRDLTMDNIVWNGGRVLIIDFGHASRTGTQRVRVESSWSPYDPSPVGTTVSPSEDVARVCMILYHLYTDRSPRLIYDTFREYDPRGYWFGVALRDHTQVSAAELLTRLGEPPARQRTHSDPALGAGRDAYDRLREQKAKRRDPVSPPRLGRPSEDTPAAGPAPTEPARDEDEAAGAYSTDPRATDPRATDPRSAGRYRTDPYSATGDHSTGGAAPAGARDGAPPHAPRRRRPTGTTVLIILMFLVIAVGLAVAVLH